MKLNNLKKIQGFLLYRNAVKNINAFEKTYIALRQKEGRAYNEKEIAILPVVASSHPYYKEWKIRETSCNKLLKYVKGKGNVCDILEVGCGNGWLSAQLSAVTSGEVTGLDINTVELEQAKNVFQWKYNLNFTKGDIRSGVLADQKFDLIVFAASVQYFESLKEIINTALQYLTLQGEIHILDSYFYKEKEIAAARQRTKEYFDDLGFPEMAHFYFHHSIDDLETFPFSILYNPNSRINKLLFRKNPFHWIAVKNRYL